MDKIVLKRSIKNNLVYYIAIVMLLSLITLNIVFLVIKETDSIMTLIFFSIILVFITFCLILRQRTRIIVDNKKIIIKNGLFKTFIIKKESLSKITIEKMSISQKNSTNKNILFYDNKNRLITKINDFDIFKLDENELFETYLNENNIPTVVKKTNIKVNTKKNMIAIIISSIVIISLFLTIFIIYNNRFTKIVNTEYEKLDILEKDFTNVKKNENEIYLYYENNSYLIPDFLDYNYDLNNQTYFKIYYKKINNQNVIFELYDKDNKQIYSYDYFINKTISAKTSSTISIGIIIVLAALMPVGSYLIFKIINSFSIKFYNDLDKSYKIDIDGKILYKLKDIKKIYNYNDLLKKHMVTKMVNDEIYYFIVTYEKKVGYCDYYIGYTNLGRKAIIEAFVEDGSIYIEDDLNFIIDDTYQEFTKEDKLEFENHFKDIEKITNLTPKYMSEYDEKELDEKENL